jgi:hypothetical protein
MNYSYWPEFAVLMVGAVIGSEALVPYSFKLLEASENKKPLKIPPTTLAVLSFIQNLVLGAVTIGVGLFVAHKIGLGAPTIRALVSGHSSTYSLIHTVLYPVIAGLVIGLVMTTIDLAYLPHWPKPILDAAKNTSLTENFYACFYGGFNEEYLTRLFGLSIVAWLLSHAGHHTSTTPTTWVMWTSIIVMALLFAIGHLPALKGLVGKVSGLMLSRTLILNIPLGIVCGWLYWKYGIETAIIAHFTSDVIYHVGGTVLLRAKLAPQNKG